MPQRRRFMRSAIILVVAAVGVLPGAGRAQDPGATACASIENDRDRLACYDRALRATRAAAEPATPEPASPDTAVAPAAASTSPAPAAATATAAAAVAASAAL